MFRCHACLRILDSLYFYLKSFNQHENGLLFIIGSIYSYYQRFQKQINDYVQIETVAMAVEATQYDEERQKSMELFQNRREKIEPLIYELCNQFQLVVE